MYMHMYVCTCIVFLHGLVLIMNMNIGFVNMIIRCDRHSLKAANSLLGVACDLNGLYMYMYLFPCLSSSRNV